MNKKINSNKQINRSYHSHIKAILKGSREKQIYESLSAGKNSYLRLDRLASSSFDRSWIDEIEGVIFDLGEIIANPRLNTKVEGVLTPVELAKKINGETVQHLASHTQYIKEVDEYGNVIPSKLLSMYSDDDIHTYENRFIATFVRRLMLFIAKRYEYVTKFAELRNEEVLYFKNKSIVDGAEVEIETKVKVSYKSDDENATISSNYVERIKQTRAYILYFYNSPFMKLMKNEKDVRNPIVQTNIIRKNPKYHHCYEVYRFIETYDRLGVNYKIDENYSLFEQEELNELNRTLFANYITLKGKDMSKEHKTNTKIYKPKILTSLEDESFIYGPLLSGPIEFARVDAGYQEYLDSKIRKDLPLHPTKKEKEYYEDEYAQKAENRQDEKQKNDLLRRRAKEVSAFEKSVKVILAKREEARLKLLEQEKAAIAQEENDMLEAARRAIIEASKEDMPKEEPVVEEGPIKEEAKVYEPTVTFDEAADEIWPQLKNPHPLPKDEPKPIKKPAKEKPVGKPVVKEEPIKEEKVVVTPKKEEKVYTPTVSFAEAADEIWPQLKNPKPLVKEEPAIIHKPARAPKVSKPPLRKKVEEAPVKEEVKAEPKKEEKKPEPVKVAPKREEKVYTPTVSFAEAADEIWPQLKNPTPIKQEEKKQEVKPAPQKAKKEAPKKEKKAEPAKKIEPQEEKPAHKKVEEKPKAKKQEAKPAPKKEEPKKEQPKVEPKKEEAKKAQPAPKLSKKERKAQRKAERQERKPEKVMHTKKSRKGFKKR